MILAIVTLVPVALGLFLLAFGTPGRPLLAPTPVNLVLTGVAAVAAGPVALLTIGFGAWLVMVGVLVGAAMVVAGLGAPRGRAVEH